MCVFFISLTCSVLFYGTFQIKNLHPFPKDPVCHWGCSWDEETRSWCDYQDFFLCLAFRLWRQILTTNLLQCCFSYCAATKLQAGWKGYTQRSKYKKLRASGEENFALMQFQSLCHSYCKNLSLTRTIFLFYYVRNFPCSYCHPGVVERDPGQEESPAPATGCRYDSQVWIKLASRWHNELGVRNTPSSVLKNSGINLISFLFFFFIHLIVLCTGSSRASSTATRSAVLRTSTSWITCATPSSWRYAGTCPRTSWTRTGRRLPLLSKRCG